MTTAHKLPFTAHNTWLPHFQDHFERKVHTIKQARKRRRYGGGGSVVLVSDFHFVDTKH